VKGDGRKGRQEKENGRKGTGEGIQNAYILLTLTLAAA